MDIEDIKRASHKKKVQIGIIMGILCALYWGIWYVPGYAIWYLPFLDNLYTPGGPLMEHGLSSDTAYLLACLFLTGINAIACALVLFIWNGGLGKIREFKRTTVEFKAASKYFLFAGLCGACAVYGTYIAAAFLSPGFAAVAGLLYPIIGTTLSVLVLKQKVSKRAYLSIVVILVGGVTLYAGSIANDATFNTIGLIGGIMAAVGWGCEGAVAGKALDYCEPDVGLHLRFCFEALFWLIVLIVIACTGIPIFATIAQIDAVTIFAILMIGLSFAWCYVAWYKAFPMIGVPRGQAIGSLYAMCGVIFLIVFFGPTNALGSTDTIVVACTILGMIICIIGSLIMATENTEDLVSLKGDSE